MISESFSRLALKQDGTGKVVTAVQYGRTISVGMPVRNLTSVYGIKEGTVGKVVEISKPGTRNLTSNIIGVDFANCGLPTAQMKMEEIEEADLGLIG